MSQLLTYIKTTHKREVFLKYLDQCLTDKAISIVSINDDFEQILSALGIKTVQDISDELLQNIKSELLGAYTIKLSVDVVLSSTFITRLYDLLISNGEGLLDIEISSTSNGGFKLYKEGKVFNYSFDYLIGKLFVDASFKQKLEQYL